MNREIRFRTLNVVKQKYDVTGRVKLESDLGTDRVTRIMVATVPLNDELTSFAMDYAICAPKQKFNRFDGMDKAEARLMGKLLGKSAQSIQFVRDAEKHVKDQVIEIVTERTKNISWMQNLEIV